MAGPVGHRDLRVEPVAADTNPRGVDVVLLDPAELALVFGQIAPGKVAAPNSALSVRLISAFTDEQLAPSGLTNADVAYDAARQILAVGGNVLSVDTGADDDDPPGEHTVIEVADETLVAGTEGADELFGPIDVSVGETRIVGVDAVIRLGTDYLPLLADGGPPMPSVPDDDATDLAPGTSGPSTTDETLEQWMTDGTADALTVAVLAARAADEKQGRNIVVLDVGDILAIAELFVVMEAPNRRLVRSLVEDIEETVRAGDRALAAAGRGRPRAAVGADGLRRRDRPRVPRRDPPVLRDRAPLPRRADRGLGGRAAGRPVDPLTAGPAGPRRPSTSTGPTCAA